MKVQNPTSCLLAWGTDKGTGNPQGIWPYSPVEFGYKTSTGLGKTDPRLGKHKKKKTLPRHRGKEQWLHRKLNQNYLLVLEGLLWRHGSAGAHCRDGGDWQQLSGKVPFVNLTIELGHLRPKNIADNWIKALLSKALLTRARPSFSHH